MNYMILFCCCLIWGVAGHTTVSNAVEKKDVVIFGGGCFWCMEPPFEQLDGVLEVVAGYSGGEKQNPSYEDVSAGQTNHLEAVRVTYDPQKISFSELLDVYWKQVDPTDNGGQFADRGNHYTTAIFYTSEAQRNIAEESLSSLANSGKFADPIVTRILPAKPFYLAEEYHQDYYLKNSPRYKAYKKGSGREAFIKRVWEQDANYVKEKAPYTRPADAVVKESLTDLQYRVTRQDATEPPFNNEYWDNKAEGIYVDIVSGEPLFSSKDKYESGTGWPSFSRPLVAENIVEKKDAGFFMVRTEVRSQNGDSHLGHVFDDGPKPTGLRYCMNSAAMRFIPAELLREQGYEEFEVFFK